MEPHLAHRLPWQSLADAIKGTRTVENRCNKSTPPTRKQLKSLYHFSRCLHDTLTEFAATDKSSDEEKEELDPWKWNAEPYSIQAYLGFYHSIVWGYLELNLLLTDADAFEHMLLRKRRWGSDSMDAMCGWCDGGHPDSLATHLLQAFDGSGLKPLTADVRQILRDHAAKMFRCMYTLLAPRGRIDADYVAWEILHYFGLHHHIRWYCETHGYCVSLTESGDACRCETVKWSGASRFYL